MTIANKKRHKVKPEAVQQQPQRRKQKSPKIETIAHKHEALRCARCFVLTRRWRMNGVSRHHAGPVSILIYAIAPPESRTSITTESGNIAAFTRRPSPP